MTRNTFKGFSTIGRDKPPYTTVDYDLVKRDLLNTLYTKRGERVMRPNYGTNIHEYLFEPYDNVIRQNIIDEVVSVIESEPRVSLISIDIEDTERGIKIRVGLNYILDMTPMQLYANFTRNNRDND